MNTSGNTFRNVFHYVLEGAKLALFSFLQLLIVIAAAGLVVAAIALIGFTLVGNWIVAWLAYFIFLALDLALEWSSSIFNYFIDHVLVAFSATIETFGIKGGIDVVWTAFRDIANIIIIGLFVFIAINIILGVKEFGEKKAVAKVLIIAVLLNFSLLFTKIIIDASNFTAYQFYKSAGLERPANSRSGGVADAFLYAAGITTAWDTSKGVQNLGKTKGTPAAMALTFAITILLVVMIGLLLYGSFQMISRAILLVALMVTSPLAFASWLIPHHLVGRGWATWWESLLKSAFFAPLFMMALWASMLLLNNAQRARGGKTLGEFFSGSSSATDAGVVIATFSFAAGFLYFSIKFASSFTGSIPGFKYSSMAAFAPLGAASRWVAAPLLRQTLGFAGLKYSQQREAAAKAALEKSKDALLRGDTAGAKRFERIAAAELRRKSRGDAIAESRMNVMDSGLVKAARQQLGITGFTGESAAATKSLAKQIEERTKAAAALASKIAPSSEDEKAARDKVAEQRAGGKQALERDIATKKTAASEAKRAENLEDNLAKALQRQKVDEGAASQSKAMIEGDHRAGRITDAQRDTALRAEDARIARAREEVQNIQARIGELEGPFKESEEWLRRYEAQTKEMTEEVVHALRESAEGVAKEVGRTQGDILERALGKVTRANEMVAAGTLKNFKGKRGAVSRLSELLKQAEAAPSTPAAPATPASPTPPSSPPPSESR